MPFNFLETVGFLTIGTVVFIAITYALSILIVNRKQIFKKKNKHKSDIQYDWVDPRKVRELDGNEY